MAENSFKVLLLITRTVASYIPFIIKYLKMRLLTTILSILNPSIHHQPHLSLLAQKMAVKATLRHLLKTLLTVGLSASATHYQ